MCKEAIYWSFLNTILMASQVSSFNMHRLQLTTLNYSEQLIPFNNGYCNGFTIILKEATDVKVTTTTWFEEQTANLRVEGRPLCPINMMFETNCEQMHNDVSPDSHDVCSRHRSVKRWRQLIRLCKLFHCRCEEQII